MKYMLGICRQWERTELVLISFLSYNFTVRRQSLTFPILKLKGLCHEMNNFFEFPLRKISILSAYAPMIYRKHLLEF
jgi:hypothetical protein